MILPRVNAVTPPTERGITIRAKLPAQTSAVIIAATHSRSTISLFLD